MVAEHAVVGVDHRLETCRLYLLAEVDAVVGHGLLADLACSESSNIFTFFFWTEFIIEYHRHGYRILVLLYVLDGVCSFLLGLFFVQRLRKYVNAQLDARFVCVLHIFVEPAVLHQRSFLTIPPYCNPDDGVSYPCRFDFFPVYLTLPCGNIHTVIYCIVLILRRMLVR